MVSLKNVFKIILKVFLGILLTIIIELTFGIGIYSLVSDNADPIPFLLVYPFLTILISGIYLVFWKKQYALTVGLFLGFFLFMLLMTILFEVLAGPATL